jgi:hypothetical protein
MHAINLTGVMKLPLRERERERERCLCGLPRAGDRSSRFQEPQSARKSGEFKMQDFEKGR